MAPPAGIAKPKLGNMVDARLNLPSDLRTATKARAAEVTTGVSGARQELKAMAAAAVELKRAMPGLQVRYSDLTGGVEEVRNKMGSLTGEAPGVASEAIVRDFLSRNGKIYGLSTNDLNDLTALGDSSGQESGLRMLRMEQRIDGRPVFQSETRFLLDTEGRLVTSLGRMVPHARTQVSTYKAGSGLTAQEAMARLLVADGKVGRASDFAVSRQRDDGFIELSENDDFVLGTVTAREVYFPLAPGVLVPAWSLVVFTAGAEDWYALVDQETGALLWRKNIREYASTQDARFRVYVQADGTTPADSPAPQSPNNVTSGSGTQFAAIAPTIVSMSVAQDIIASPNGWINDCPGGVCTANETQTLGNNTVTCLDRDGTGNNVCDITAASVLDGNGRPTGNPDANTRNRDFLGTAPRDFQTGFLPPPQTTAADAEVGQTCTGNGNNGTLAIDQFRRGMVTHLFYLTNWYHDKLYRLGFDEPAGNFQLLNLAGMGGLGNDRIAGDAEDGSGVNNANFATAPDGTAGRMQMFRFTGPTIARDGGLDAEIVLHELSHGTSNRLVGNAAGLNWDSARGMGEGWSDFYALSLLNNTNADNPNGHYGSGGYATYKLQAGFLDNYLYGIRRFPYTTDNTVNPMTWADVDDVTNSMAGGIPVTPVNFNGNGGMEVHNSGEIWALTLWEVRSRVIADPAGANGDVPTGNQTMLRMVTNGLKMTPIDPSFPQARDAILNADCAASACANEASIWGGFADRGLGYGSKAPFNNQGRFVRSHQGVHESFSLPFLDVVNAFTDVTLSDASGNNNGAVDPGEPVQLTVKLTNPWRAASKAVTGATATLTTSTPGVTIWDNASTYGAIAPQGTATGDSFLITVDTTVLCASAIDFTLSTTSNLGTTSTTFRVRIGNRVGTDPVVTYTSTPAPAKTIVDGQPRGVIDNLVVTDDLEIADVDFRVNAIAHPGVGDLTGLLRSPDGLGTDLITLIDGLNDLGGTTIANMVIDDDVAAIATNDLVQATTAATPYTKSWLPVSNSPWITLVAPALHPDTVPNLSVYDKASTKGTWSTVFADVFTLAAGGTAGNGTMSGWSILVTPVHFTCTAFAPAGNVAATKTVSGTFSVGGTVTYTVTLTNNGTDGQLDNAGHEFTDTLPASLTLVSATATSGTATTAGNTANWDGTLAPLGGTVTITITATINAGAQGTTISNQGSTSYDSNNDNTNDATHLTDDPGQGGATDPTVFGVGSSAITGTKTVSGTFRVGQTVTYTVILSNSGGTASPDNAGNEFTDTLPASLTLTGASASSGTAATAGNTANWNGAIPAGGSVTITITATINTGAQGTTISNQGTFNFDADLNGTNESSGLTDDPAVGGTSDPTNFFVEQLTLQATKTASGSFETGSTLTYSIVITNGGNVASPDNAGDEFTDTLPAGLTLVSATASAGTAFANTGTNTVTWNGSVPANGSVTITIQATITATEGGTITNQGTLSYDADLNGTNETTRPTDDPSVDGATDPTSITVQPGVAADVPTLDELGLFALAFALLGAAWVTLRRRKAAL